MDTLQQDVLSAIADDYEEISTILSDLRSWHPESAIREEDVVKALGELIRLGLASPYELSTTGPARSDVFDLNRLNDLYFYVTAEGKKKVLSS